MSPKKPCPCGTGSAYGDCCRPFHRGLREPETAGQLMRSRYSAFALSDVPYLIRTLHEFNDERELPLAQLTANIREACHDNRYMGLKILEERPADASGIARVRFIARVFHKGGDVSFEELSSFAHDGTGWRYLRGEEQRAAAKSSV